MRGMKGVFSMPIGILFISLVVAMMSIGVVALSADESIDVPENTDNIEIIDGVIDEPSLNISKEGLLIVAHGMPGQWNARVMKTMSEVDVGRPTEIGFLEHSPIWTIGSAVESLLSEDIDSIVVVPIFICGNSSHSIEVFEDVEEAIGDRLPFFITESMEDHDLILEILIDHGLGLCGSRPYRPRDKVVNPEDASLLLYAHGDSDEFFEGWEKLAEKVEESLTYMDIFKEVKVAWAGDDLEDKLQNAKGHPLVVPWMISYSEYSDAEIRLNGLGYDYEYDGKHLMDHTNSIRWVEWEFENWKDTFVYSNHEI